MKKILLSFLFLITLSMPVLVSAMDFQIVTCGNTVVDPSGDFSKATVKPCTFDDVLGIINALVNWFLVTGISVAVITMIVAGSKILLQPGSDTARGDAKNMIIKTMIGLVIVLGSWIVIKTITVSLTGQDCSNHNFLRFLC